MEIGRMTRPSESGSTRPARHLRESPSHLDGQRRILESTTTIATGETFTRTRTVGGTTGNRS